MLSPSINTVFTYLFTYLIERKASIVVIVNNDQLCMRRAISVGCAKLNRCSAAEWKDIVSSEECLELIWNGTSVKSQQFDFKKEMKEYCVSKVESLTFFDKLVSNSDSFL